MRSLLASDQQAGSFLDNPAIEGAARAIALQQGQGTPEIADSLTGQNFSHYRILKQAKAEYAKLP